jgi:subtilisin family serine protease
MNTKKALFSLAFILFLAAATSAQAATSSDSRYFVKSTSSLWKKSFQVRNVFDSGFTTDLSDWQLKMAKVFGLEVTPVKKLNILATPTPTPTPKKSASKSLLKTPTNQIGWGVQALYNDALDNALPSGGKDVKVAILDTGILLSHPDLKSQVVVCDDLTTSDAFVKNSCDDKNGHGTQVAGVVAANGGPDGKGIYGVAPEASLMIYKVCAIDGTCFADDVATAIRRATDDGANIIVLSLGTDTVSSIMNDAISYANSHNVLLIAAAGNDGPYNDSIDFPASNASVVSVGAVDQSLSVADWSARGDNADITSDKKDGDLEFVAPGVNIESTSNNTDYVTISGTSMAAAHIAGLAAKEWQSDSEHPAEATRDFLHKISQSVSSKPDAAASGWGMPQL